jgi:hypothetical protein
MASLANAVRFAAKLEKLPSSLYRRSSRNASVSFPVDRSERRCEEHEMDAISLTYAKAHLSELVDRVEAGDLIDITRCGSAHRAADRRSQAAQAC